MHTYVPYRRQVQCWRITTWMQLFLSSWGVRGVAYSWKNMFKWGQSLLSTSNNTQWMFFLPTNLHKQLIIH